MTVGKQPAFQFYIGDWLKDTGTLSLESRGAWIDLLCFMWHSKDRGLLCYTIQEYSRLLRTSKQKAIKVIFELIDLKICDCFLGKKKIEKIENVKNETFCNTKVTLINRRMFNEAIDKNYNRLRVIKHRMKQKCNGNVMLYSSSSSSSSKKYIKKFDCNTCNFGFEIEKNFYECRHPDIELLGIKTAVKKLCIVGSDKDRDDFFQWPAKYNIHWLFNCDGYNSKKNNRTP